VNAEIETGTPLMGRLMVVCVATALMVAAGCSSTSESDGDGGAGSDETTSTTTPTTEVLPSSDNPPVEATFDGDACTVEDSTEIPAGDYAFIMTSSVGDGAQISVHPLPEGTSWAEYVTASSDTEFAYENPPVSFTPLPDLAENQRAARYIVDQGEYAIWGMRMYPSTGEWLCGRLTVTE